MKRITSLLLAVLALTIVTVSAVSAQDQYPQGTTDQAQPSGTVEQTPTTTADQSTTVPSSELPATASPMPLVALGGLAAMALGATLRRRKA